VWGDIMFEWLKIKWANRRSRKIDDFIKDELGHAVANKYDVNDFPNEPEDFETPPIRLPEDEKSRSRLWKSLNGLSP